ncbi:MAG TPA: relaxase/mobilization nuclease domain-containing protein [Magnetospirillaceae bacterium]|jgi:hypothetical protein
MIIKGNAAGSVKFWSKHLLRDDTNSRAEVVEITGLMAEDLPSALKEMKAIADQSRCHGKFMYQANINPRADEHLTPEQWREAVDTLEKNLGLEGHQRIVIEHEKESRIHRHIVWNRVDVETLRVTDIGGNYYTHQRTARELEERFGLEHTQSLHGERRENGRPDRPPEQWEQRKAAETLIDPNWLKRLVTELWEASNTGQEFKEALESKHYILAKGDRRDFCIVDGFGDVHSLARRIEGVRAKDVRERMADVDREALPTVAEASKTQEERRAAAEETLSLREKPITPQQAAERDAVRSSYEGASSEQKWNDPHSLGYINWAPEGVRNAYARRPINENTEHTPPDPPEPHGGKREALYVADALTGAAMGLVDFIGSLFTRSQRGQPTTPEGKSQVDQILTERRAAAALENIRESIERGDNLRPSDIMRLTDSHLENIRLRGDDYMRELVAGIQKSRERESDWGRDREP